MSSDKKTLSNQLSALLLPKLKGLSEKNAKKVLVTAERTVKVLSDWKVGIHISIDDLFFTNDVELS